MADSSTPDLMHHANLLTEMVQINSVNPLQVGERSGPGGEAEMAQWVAARADAAGASEVVLDPVEPGRPNVYARFDGAGEGHVAIDVHLDTVGIEHMTGDPLDGRIADGRLYGRGAVDTKATLAVVLPILAGRANKLLPGPTVHLLGTVGEEAGGLIGAYRFLEWAQARSLQFDQIIVAEPTLCSPVHGHKGGVGLEVTVKGEAAHSSKPELGANAIVGAARVVEAFEQEQNRLAAQPVDNPVGAGTLSVTEISGGLARNIIPDQCHLYAGRRVAPGEDPEAIFADLSSIARRAAEPFELDIEMSNDVCSPAFYEEPDSELITTLCELSGEKPGVASYGSNALVYRPIAKQIAVFGPGSIDQAHKAVEWVELSELERAVSAYRLWLGLPSD